MKALLWSIIVTLLVSFSNATVKNHTCVPTGYSAICRLEYVFYNRKHADTHIFPTNYSHIRIGHDGWNKGIRSLIKEFDHILYAELGQPPVIEMMGVEMVALEIPTKLKYGNFADNNLGWFSVEHNESDPALTFLDLGSNHIRNLTNISSLVNLEALYLTYNHIEIVEFSVLKNLTKLKVLNLHYNSIHHMYGEKLPTSLIYLGLYNNQIRKLNYSDLSLPVLEKLNLERNRLKTIDASALILAMPKLKSIVLGGNDFSIESFKELREIFDRHNITYSDQADENDCNFHEELVDGVCMKRKHNTSGWLKATGFSILSVLIAIGFVFLVRRVFIEMSK